MDLLREKLRCTPMGAALPKGSKSSNTSATTVTNTDERMALQDAVGINGNFNRFSTSSSSYSVDNSNSPDAVKALAAAGADVLKNAGGSIVDLNRDSVNANSKNFDTLVNGGVSLVDKLIDASVKTTQAGTALAGTAVESFKPTENANVDVVKYGVIAAGVIAAALVLKGSK